jgi:glucose-6-phosphate 1-dehydrogenase
MKTHKEPVRASRLISKDDLCRVEQPPQACGMVLFGASGDLAARKLLPSLAQLSAENILPKSFYLLGVSRTPKTSESYRREIAQSLKAAGVKDKGFVKRCDYLAGDGSDPGFYRTLSAKLAELDRLHGVTGRRLFYLSTAPSLFSVIAHNLHEAKLSRPPAGGWTRLVIEKPFGRDLASAETLNTDLRLAGFREDQIYRIDHYMGKETVQNILMMRFANLLFEPAWNSHYVDHVQITNAETLGVEHRAGYYDQAGVVRDMFQNHLLQVLSLVAMEPPAGLGADGVRDRKLDVFRAIKPLEPNRVVLGQYSRYRREPGVARDSRTPTFAALRLEIDTWRWHKVPFYLRSGKCLAERVTEIAVVFRHVPVSIFKPLLADQLCPNVVRLRIQPDEGISMRFEAKHPGPKLCMSSVTMDFGYQRTFGVTPPEAYTRLLLDAMNGDQTLFARSDAVEQCWRVIAPALRVPRTLASYKPGSWGPAQAQALLEREGRRWDLPYA